MTDILKLRDLINKIGKIHFIGIGGVSMSALAEVMQNRGKILTGSDSNDSDIINRLKSLGIKINIGQSEKNIENPELVVYTAAIKSDNPELLTARKKGIPCVERAPFLGALMLDYETPICVAGTHGKTTTTSMISEIFINASLDPTIQVGGVLPSIGGNYKAGGEKYFIAEACEYCDSFLNFYPKIAVILNIEEDHLDYFSDIDGIIKSFTTFANNTLDGLVIINNDNDNCRTAAANIKGEIITFGINSISDYTGVIIDDNIFELLENSKKLGIITLKVFGKHNIENALAAIAVARSCNINFQIIQKSLSDFSGTKRRFEYKGTINGFMVYDDYAHHPTEINATLTTARKMAEEKLFVVFQSHTFTRTAALLSDFAKVLSLADKAIIVPIYSAREKDTGIVSHKILAEKIPNAQFADSFEQAAEMILKEAKENDLVITMGAGDVDKAAELILKGGY